MDKPTGKSTPFSPCLDGSQSEPCNQSTVKLLHEISGHLYALADLVDEIRALPPEQLSRMLTEGGWNPEKILAEFGLTLEDIERAGPLN